MISLLKRFLIMCSGASQEILNRPECAIEYNKYMGIGATIFTTAILAFLSAYYALYLTLRSLPISIFLGLLWALIIFNLDRYLVLALKRKRIPPDLPLSQRIKIRTVEIYVVIPRLLLTILISVTIAYPLEMKLFEAEIAAQLENQEA